MTQDTPAQDAVIPTQRRRAIRGPMTDRIASGLTPSDDTWTDGTHHLLWTRSVNSSGYPQIADDTGRLVLLHRAYYELTVGPIPAGYEVDHRCRNRRCVAHLEAVTRAENQRRTAPYREGKLKDRCKRDHELSGDNVRVYVNPKTGKIKRHCRACAGLRG